MDKNLKQEACQLYIEQEIETGLADGKTAYKIGKELTKEIEQLFEAKVNPGTIEKRAQRIRTNVRKSESENTDKLQTNNVRTDKSKLKKILKQISIEELQDVISKATIISKDVGADQSIVEIINLGLDMYYKK